MEFVPRWHLFNIVFSTGRRLDKFQKLTITKSTTDVRTPLNGLSTSRQLAVVKDRLFSFDNEEYRFWCVEMGENTNSKELIPRAASCRFCGTIAYTTSSRKKHMEEHQCTTKLIVCYNSLLKDGKCVVCDILTQERKWGVPLHKGVCEKYWMFDEPCPEALASSINLYKRQRGAS